MRRPLAEQLDAAPRTTQYVFPGSDGGQPPSAIFHRKTWAPATAGAREASLRKKPRPHDLRRTRALWLLAQGISLLAVSCRLGHSSTEMTSRVYGRLMSGAQNDAAAAMERALAG